MSAIYNNPSPPSTQETVREAVLLEVGSSILILKCFQPGEVLN